MFKWFLIYIKTKLSNETATKIMYNMIKKITYHRKLLFYTGC